MMWNRLSEAETGQFLFHKRSARPFAGVPVEVEDEAVRRSFVKWHKSKLDEYAYRFRGRLMIEPQHGYVVSCAQTLIAESMPYHFYGGEPSFERHKERQQSLTNFQVVRERAVISLRDFEDANYYHFYNDVLAKLRVLEHCDETQGLPLVVSRKLFEQKFFREAIRRSRKLRGRRVIVQNDSYVEAKEIYCAKPLPHAKENFDFALDILEVPPANSRDAKRIFLTRRKERPRGLVNTEEVETVCRNYGFEITDATALSLDEQIKLFAQARFVVGVHGAGLTNIMFRRRAPLKLLELFPHTNIPPHYAWLCRHYGFAYDALVGTDGDAATQTFAIDVNRLNEKLAQLLTCGD